MKQNTNIFIMIGFVFLACGQLQGYFECLDNWKIFVWKMVKLGIPLKAIKVVEKSVIVPVEKRIAQRRIENRLKEIKKNTFNPMFSRALGAILDCENYDSYRARILLENAQTKVMLELNKAVTKEIVEKNASAVEKVLATAEEEMRNAVIRLVETKKFDDDIIKQQRKQNPEQFPQSKRCPIQWTVKLLQVREEKIAEVISLVKDTEQEVERGSKLVWKIAKMSKAKEFLISKTLSWTEKEIRFQAQNAISAGGKELLAKVMPRVMEDLPYEIIDRLRNNRY